MSEAIQSKHIKLAKGDKAELISIFKMFDTFKPANNYKVPPIKDQEDWNEDDELVKIFTMFDRFEPAKNVTVPALDDMTHMVSQQNAECGINNAL